MDFEKFKEEFRAALEADVASGEFQRRIDEMNARDEERRTNNISHLLPCPCCGGRAVRGPNNSNGFEITWDIIECEDCHLQTPSWGEKSAEEIWQKRV